MRQVPTSIRWRIRLTRPSSSNHVMKTQCTRYERWHICERDALETIFSFIANGALAFVGATFICMFVDSEKPTTQHETEMKRNFGRMEETRFQCSRIWHTHTHTVHSSPPNGSRVTALWNLTTARSRKSTPLARDVFHRSRYEFRVLENRHASTHCRDAPRIHGPILLRAYQIVSQQLRSIALRFRLMGFLSDVDDRIDRCRCRK